MNSQIIRDFKLVFIKLAGLNKFALLTSIFQAIAKELCNSLGYGHSKLFNIKKLLKRVYYSTSCQVCLENSYIVH